MRFSEVVKDLVRDWTRGKRKGQVLQVSPRCLACPVGWLEDEAATPLSRVWWKKSLAWIWMVEF